MQKYKFGKNCDCVVLRWSSGYLSLEKLKNFLIKARKALTKNPTDIECNGVIFLADNVTLKDEKTYYDKEGGQWVRT